MRGINKLAAIIKYVYMTDNLNNERPSFKEWAKQNPRKSINDYYRIYGTGFSDSTIKPRTETVNSSPPIDLTKQTEETKKTLNNSQIICIIFSIVLAIAYFLPWIEFDFMGFNVTSASGYEIPKIIRSLEFSFDFFSSQPTNHPTNYYYVLHLIPLCCLTIIISTITKTKGFILLAEILLIAIMAWFIYKLTNLKVDTILNLMGIGLYISLVCILYFLIDFFKLLSKL